MHKVKSMPAMICAYGVQSPENMTAVTSNPSGYAYIGIMKE